MFYLLLNSVNEELVEQYSTGKIKNTLLVNKFYLTLSSENAELVEHSSP